ncbi:MAG TPA: aminotransferase class V-fold PLP-dependent enzyme [Kofleriaceae bacterium]|nr:aminotransferase class V-fold PLP-dependent enzyme [Kofleriaceae bacterium]
MALPPHGLEPVGDWFPVTRSGKVFLAHCSVSPLPRRVADAITRQIESATLGDRPDERAARLVGFRHGAAALLGAAPDEIAFVTNTVEGVRLVASGFRWAPGDNIVGGAIEFPANIYPWMGLRAHGVELRLVEPRAGRLTVEDVRAACDARTRMIALSSVQFLSGQRTDVHRIGELCRERGIRFFVDAIQGLGALAFDVRRIAVDYLSAGGHKWLLGPLGSGVFYCRREAADDLGVPLPGHRSMVPRADHLPYAYEVRRDAARFEVGAMNHAGICGLEASIELLARVGIERIEARILALTAQLADGLRSRGYELLSPEDDGERSGIVAFHHRGIDPDGLAIRLRRAGIVVSPMSGWVRCAPHFYNEPQDIENALSALVL